jgi:hypothetical protein
MSLDDIRIINSQNAPPAALLTNTADIGFGYVPVLTPAVKSFVLSGYDLTGEITLTSSGNYSAIQNQRQLYAIYTFHCSGSKHVSKMVFVQFLPLQNSVTYSGIISIRTPGVADLFLNVTGNSINANVTLEVVNWNIEWFGSNDPSLGPN